MRVLLVDDNQDAVELLGEALSLSGHEVRLAQDGLGAVAVASALLPHAAFIDIGLPGIDGYEVATRLRALPALRDTLLVALTGYAHAEVGERARRAGFDRHLVKPALLDVIEALLADLRR